MGLAGKILKDYSKFYWVVSFPENTIRFLPERSINHSTWLHVTSSYEARNQQTIGKSNFSLQVSYVRWGNELSKSSTARLDRYRLCIIILVGQLVVELQDKGGTSTHTSVDFPACWFPVLITDPLLSASQVTIRAVMCNVPANQPPYTWLQAWRTKVPRETLGTLVIRLA